MPAGRRRRSRRSRRSRMFPRRDEEAENCRCVAEIWGDY
jgi:hypothetical protein